ncbi:hypothetical protein D3875_08320 [Deinococcus cavernae]|uniref:Uncharacterized protein n=1 Tax=Deinococcus cavernae TaxID=2320857 RepID=A0A418V656_9DEIO|nr:hypothetical protein [Deinococcus cavernae]RJF71577.1 hypothetical protein D3875_08320 [Deinococcus cavernae]
MTLLLVPDLGDLFRLQPQFNAGTVVEVLRSLGASRVLWASGPDADHPLRDALPAAGIEIVEGFAPDWAWAQADQDKLAEYLQQYPQGRERLRAAGHSERVFAEVLSAPLSPATVLGEGVMQAVRTYHDTLREQLDEGPGTVWREKRLGELVKALEGQSGAVLVPLDDLPRLLELLPGAGTPDLTTFQPGETSRLRALADRAWQLGEDDDLNALLDALTRESGDAVTPKAELDAAAASIYFAAGELTAAREMLEKAAHALTDDLPRSLAGLTLARLGQVRDALGERELAQRTYRAILALNYAPQVARDVAEAGLKAPFQLDLGQPE